jgi:ABC-type multidrug transport system fused ATPase/permease subunit
MTQKSNDFVRFLAYVRPYWKYVLLGALGGIIKFTIPLLGPQATRYLLDNVYLNPDLTLPEKVNQLLLYVGGLMAIFVVIWAPGTFARSYYAAMAGQKAVFDLRTDLYYRILRMSASFFERNKSGSIVSRIISDIALAQNLVGSALTNVWMDGAAVVVVLVFMIQIDVPVTLVALATLPLYVYAFKRLRGEIRSSTHRVQEEIATMSGNVQEKIAGRIVVHAFTQEKNEERNFLQDANRLFSSTLRRSFYQSLNQTVIGTLTNLSPLLVTMFGGYRVIQGHMTVGELVAISLYLSPLFTPIRRFSDLNVVFANSMAALERIFDIMDQKPEIRNRPNARRLQEIEGRVAFKQVSFAYQNAPEEEPGPVLCDIDLIVEPGQQVALVGPSGSGKSTLVSLIPRFYDVGAGAVRIDGHDVRDVRISSLRRHIGMVMQDAILFSGTIIDNLRYGNPSASRKEVIAACEAANACEFIESLPNGFDTEVGEGGTFLSGGQKQRLTIARAFLKDPRILILDEATSAIDATSEKLIQEALEKLRVGRTTLIIAHRLSTIVNADKIIVLEDGEIVERGTHDELLQYGGIYHRLYTQQFAMAHSLPEAAAVGERRALIRAGVA